jgi:uncharacterized protein
MMNNKKTLVLGATPNPGRYAYIAINRLLSYGHPVVAVGLKKGEVSGITIEPPVNIHDDIDTITLYVGPQNQEALYDYIINTHPKRVIFNPGTENQELENILISKNIEPVEACTLVLLATNQF